MTNAWRWRGIGVVVALVLYFVDQWIKTHVTLDMGLRHAGPYEVIANFFYLTWVPNYGVSLGMFSANTVEARWILVGVTGLITAAVFIWMLREKLAPEILGLSLILGGALGNIHDRFVLGYVVDYLDFRFAGWTPFVFNLADAGISVGVAIILARALFMSEKPATAHDANKADTPAETN